MWSPKSFGLGSSATGVLCTPHISDKSHLPDKIHLLQGVLDAIFHSFSQFDTNRTLMDTAAKLLSQLSYSQAAVKRVAETEGSIATLLAVLRLRSAADTVSGEPSPFMVDVVLSLSNLAADGRAAGPCFEGDNLGAILALFDCEGEDLTKFLLVAMIRLARDDAVRAHVRCYIAQACEPILLSQSALL